MLKPLTNTFMIAALSAASLTSPAFAEPQDQEPVASNDTPNISKTLPLEALRKPNDTEYELQWNITEGEKIKRVPVEQPEKIDSPANGSEPQ